MSEEDGGLERMSLFQNRLLGLYFCNMEIGHALYFLETFPKVLIIVSYMKYSLHYVTDLPDTNTYEDIVFKLKCEAKLRRISPRDGPPATLTYCR